MRRRVALIVVAAVVGLVAVPAGPVASAGPRTHVFAQSSGTDSSGGESGNKGSKGQSDPNAETGASNTTPAAEEEGPPWTYQMARIGIGLLVLMFLGLGLLYYRMVVSRQRGVA
jgi:hypothetical protein